MIMTIYQARLTQSKAVVALEMVVVTDTAEAEVANYAEEGGSGPVALGNVAADWNFGRLLHH